MPIEDTSATYLGISNENEFYSHYYLSQVFAKDVKETLDGWVEREKTDKESEQDEAQKYKAPFNRLKLLKTPYFAMQQQLKRERSARRRVEMQRGFFQELLSALEYGYQPSNKVLEDQSELPILGQVSRGSLTSSLVIIGAYDPDQEGLDPLALTPHRDQYHGEVPPDDDILQQSWNELITKRLFAQEHPPRWVLLLSDRQLLLIDRLKWNQNRLLRFEWDEILGRQDDATLKATAVLLHQQSLLPDEGICLLDSLDENAHKHAFEVSEDLKYALRECIELLGNEAADYLIKHTRTGFTGKEALDADKLTRECLRYMYRLLFLFYIEARPELGYVPHQSEAYRLGYSLERLRDLEKVQINSKTELDGSYIHLSIQRLFQLIHSGYDGEDEQRVAGSDLAGDAIHNSFRIEGLDSHLFNPQYTPQLNKVKFRNETLQRVIELMSLTRPGGKRKRRGRVSYSQLGINQLGAVYEALLSYRGFFAAKDLYEVKKAGTEPDELETGYFVSSADLEQYEEEEKVYDKNEAGKKVLRKFIKGTFIYRLAGRDRQKSASYYTPEVLTKCLVKYALKELLQGKTADEILELTICEPAMGSAAFLNEAVNQLSEAYLERKQGELNERIPHDDYGKILQQVKMYIADRNTFGVDLNPVAVELAEVSLWLNAIHEGRQVPWFGYQLFAGNSLIGARRQVYDVSLLGQRPKGQAWYEEAPVRLNPFSLSGMAETEATKNYELSWQRSATQVYHFLLPDPGMANYTDKVAKSLEPENFQKIKDWRKQFTKPFAKDDIDTLLFLSKKIDELWVEHARQLAADRERTEDELAVWPHKQAGRITSTSDKDKIHRGGIFNLNSNSASAYRRLKAAMDYWCALWFWPIDQADLLPTRESFLMEMALILSGDVIPTSPEQGDLSCEDEEEVVQPKAAQKWQVELDVAEVQDAAAEYKDGKGRLKIEELAKNFPRLALVERLSFSRRFLHWELMFADIFSSRGGFDFTVGNPPWLKLNWSYDEQLGELMPVYELREIEQQNYDERLKGDIRNLDVWPNIRYEYEQHSATQNYLNSLSQYGELKGQQTNLYKAFLVRIPLLMSRAGVAGVLHPETVYTDAKGGRLRSSLYPRLRSHFQFQNQFEFFPIPHRQKYSINIYGGMRKDVSFDSISNVFHPVTIDQCYANDDQEVPLLKDDSGNWNLMGSSTRLIQVNDDALKVFGNFFEGSHCDPLEVKLPSLHASSIVGVLSRSVSSNTRLKDLLEDEPTISRMFEETYVQREHIAVKCGEFVTPLVVKGPHFYVSNPLYKTPRNNCRNKADYDVIDALGIPSGYIPRSNYRVLVDDVASYLDEDGRKNFENYKLIFRRRLPTANERTLIAALYWPEVLHTHQCHSLTFSDAKNLAITGGFASSLVYDFFVKIIGKEDLSIPGLLEFPASEKYIDEIVIRFLKLNCIAERFAEFWQQSLSEISAAKVKDPSAKVNEWRIVDVYRSFIDRRKALLEIDVLVAISIGITLEELISIYRVQFPVLRQNENDTWYDVSGNIVFTGSKGLVGIGLTRQSQATDKPLTIEYPDGRTEEKPLGWKDISPHLIKGSSPGQDKKLIYQSVVPDGTKIHRKVIDDTLPAGPSEKIITYVAPFYLPNREADYRIAWEAFSERFKDEVT